MCVYLFGNPQVTVMASKYGRSVNRKLTRPMRTSRSALAVTRRSPATALAQRTPAA